MDHPADSMLAGRAFQWMTLGSLKKSMTRVGSLDKRSSSTDYEHAVAESKNTVI